MSKEFRQDIAGLRAVAVLAVTLFHITYVFKPEGFGFSGGFLGVDIFFVISGYLMTMIIMTGINNNRFSLWSFYKRRAQRICPALLIVVLVTILVGFAVLQNDYARVALREGLVSLGFISNFRYARSVDYFDGGDLSHLFLHTWSLSVEWQFYLFYPLILIAVNKIIGKKYIASVLLVLTLLSFITAIVWTDTNARQSYYLLPSRACELLVGSIAYFYPLSYFYNLFIKNKIINKMGGGRNNSSPLFEGLGLIIICLSLLIIDDHSGWPSVWLALPMFGTYLCIAANNKNSLLRSVFFQKIGLWSYSIYLVHWPLIVYAASMGLGKYQALWIFPIFILGYLLHHLVERKRNYGRKFAVAYFACAGLLAAADNNKFLEYINFDELSVYEKTISPDMLRSSNVVIGDAAPKFILHGDSHALDLVMPMLDRKAPFIMSIFTNCYSYGVNVKQNDKLSYEDDNKMACNALYAKTSALAQMYPDIPMVFVQNWPIYGVKDNPKEQVNFHARDRFDLEFDSKDYFKLLEQDLTQLSEDFPRRNLFIIGKKQENLSNKTGNIVNQAVLKHWISNLMLKDMKGVQVDYVDYEINSELIKIIERVNALHVENSNRGKLIYVDPAVHCNAGKCNLFVNQDVQVYSDENHYSRAGAERAVEHIFNTLGVKAGSERTSFDVPPEPLVDVKQKVLSGSKESGFYLE